MTRGHVELSGQMNGDWGDSHKLSGAGLAWLGSLFGASVVVCAVNYNRECASME